MLMGKKSYSTAPYRYATCIEWLIRELGMLGYKFIRDSFIFIRINGAGGINQHAPGLKIIRALSEYFILKRRKLADRSHVPIAKIRLLRKDTEA